MAGEDPGVSSIAVLLEAIQRAWAAATGSVKAVVSGTMDLIKTGMFISWRRKMMKGQTGPDLVHGQQSLKDLRLHEQVGAHIVSVEIGDFKMMDALCEELKRMEIDFAITEHDHQYTLHYKDGNEQDVLYAQQSVLEKLYGDRGGEEREQQTPDEPDPRNNREQDDAREERRDDEQDRQEEQSQDDQGGQEEQSQDDQSRQNEQDAQEQQDRESRDQKDEPTPIPVPQESHEREQSGREVPQPQQVPGAEKTASVGSKPEFEPLSDVMKRAKERAAAKNLARKQGLDQDMRLDRSMNKVRARELEHSH